MGLVGRLFLLGLVSAVGVGLWLNNQRSEIPIPRPDPDAFWSEEKPKSEDTIVRPFRIQIPDEILEDLDERIHMANRFAMSLQGMEFEYGVNSVFLQDVQQFWLHEYHWRDREAELNKLPHFITSIEGLNIHFLHVKPQEKAGQKVIPMIMLHGWPGSFIEFLKIIPLLTQPQQGQKFVFELVIPSLPGYGFSEASSRPGLNALGIAQIMQKLMVRLGYEKFYVQGGDWGSIIGSYMAALYPDKVVGYHSNMCSSNSLATNMKLMIGSVWPSLFMNEQEASRVYPLGSFFKRLARETGYMHIQATKPDTVGYALNDSPLGLAAYILEKFSTWTNDSWVSKPKGGLPGPYTMTMLLDNVMIYYITGTITSSMRLYAETFSADFFARQMDSFPLTVPTGCAMFPNELVYQPESFLRDRYYNLVSYTSMAKGGHFAAMEQPKLLAADIFKAVQIIEDLHMTVTKN